MNNTISFDRILGAAQGDENNMLGKFLYFSLSNILVDKERLEKLCEDLDMACGCGKRLSVVDAFKSATGDIKDRLVVRKDGEQKIYQVYCRDNKGSSKILSRELIKETMHQRTNRYEKLANIHYDKADGLFGYGDLSFDTDVDAASYCQQAERLFELYQTCANRRQIETICLNFLRGLDATKVNVNGHLYFVPRHTMEKVAVFETFIEKLSELNRNDTALTVNSFYIIDDAKQRDKMTEEFYSAVKREISEYQERADYFIKSGCASPPLWSGGCSRSSPWRIRSVTTRTSSAVS